MHLKTEKSKLNRPILNLTFKLDKLPINLGYIHMFGSSMEFLRCVAILHAWPIRDWKIYRDIHIQVILYEKWNHWISMNTGPPNLSALFKKTRCLMHYPHYPMKLHIWFNIKLYFMFHSTSHLISFSFVKILSIYAEILCIWLPDTRARFDVLLITQLTK